MITETTKQLLPEERQETKCACVTCKQMCMRSPCFPTPAEVVKLIEAGHKNKLMGAIYIDPTGNSRKVHVLVAPKKTHRGCIFLDDRAFCTLHFKGLKPLEGRLAHHDQSDNGLRAWIGEKWDTPQGVEVLKMFE